MPDYQKAIIYCIKSINDDENNGDIVYYGSTTQTLNKRWSKHKNTLPKTEERNTFKSNDAFYLG